MKIGIDLGGSHIAIGVITNNGKMIKKYEKNISFVEQKDGVKEQIRDTMLSLINSILKDSEIPAFSLEGIGIGIPGIVENNKIKKCDKFGITNWDLAKEIEECLKIPVKLQNDAYCAAIAEKEFGSLKEANKAVFLCFGTGIGGVSLIDNKINPAEYGHMIIERNGRICYCGNKGCFETYGSMKVFKEGVIELLQLNSNTTSEELKEIIKEEKQNEKLNNYIEEYINSVLIGISNIVHIINPEKICIGGSFVYFEEILYKRLVEKLNSINCLFKKPEIVLVVLGNDAGIIGASML